MSDMTKYLLYNPNTKEQFINRSENLGTRKTLNFIFGKTAHLERLMKKDLMEMNLEELSIVLKSLLPSTSTASYNNLIRIEGYIKWYHNKRGIEKKESPFVDLDRKEWAQQFVSSYANKVYTRDDILGMCDELVNYVDKAVLLLIFEGVKGHSFSEILNLKATDIHKTVDIYTIEITEIDGSKRTIPISEELVEILYKADKEREYISNNGEINSQQYAPIVYDYSSPYIFKKTNRGLQGGKLQKLFVNRKFYLYKKLFNAPHLSASAIELSGMMHEMNKYRQKDGKFDVKHVYAVAERYNTPMQNDRKTRKYTVALEKVNTEEFKKTYGYAVNS